jgi:hypothetical protein
MFDLLWEQEAKTCICQVAAPGHHELHLALGVSANQGGGLRACQLSAAAASYLFGVLQSLRESERGPSLSREISTLIAQLSN